MIRRAASPKALRRKAILKQQLREMDVAETEPQESYTTKIKKWFAAFYKAPYFGLKIIPILIAISLVALIATSAFHYFSEPLSYFDPERLGQLGDFLGGTINPLVGFFTVILLFISISIQRKELRETSESFKLQNNLMIQEQTRSELIPIMEQYHDKLSKNSKIKFDLEIRPNENELISMFIGDSKSLSLEDIYHISIGTEGVSELIHELFMNHDPRTYSFFSPIWKQLNEAKSLMEEIDRQMIDYISVVQLKSVERFWFSKYQNALYFCSSIGAIAESDRDSYLEKIQPIRQKFIFPE